MVYDESPGKREAYSKTDTLLGRVSFDLEPLRTRDAEWLGTRMVLVIWHTTRTSREEADADA